MKPRDVKQQEESFISIYDKRRITMSWRNKYQIYIKNKVIEKNKKSLLLEFFYSKEIGYSLMYSSQ